MAESNTPSNNIYTVLVFIALVVLLVGVGYVWYRSYQVTGSANPFQVGQSAWQMLPSLPVRAA